MEEVKAYAIYFPSIKEWKAPVETMEFSTSELQRAKLYSTKARAAAVLTMIYSCPERPQDGVIKTVIIRVT